MPVVRGGERIVDFDEAAALDFDADLFQAQTLAVGQAADRDQDHLGVDRFAWPPLSSVTIHRSPRRAADL